MLKPIHKPNVPYRKPLYFSNLPTNRKSPTEPPLRVVPSDFCPDHIQKDDVATPADSAKSDGTENGVDDFKPADEVVLEAAEKV